MNRIYKTTFVVLFPVLLQACAGNPRQADSREATHQATSGSEVVIDSIYFAGPDCRSLPFVVQVTSPARHGTLIVRPATRTIAGRLSPIGEPDSRCDGRRVDARELVYQSRPGYTGADKFEVFVRNNQNPDEQRFVPYRIEVRPR